MNCPHICDYPALWWCDWGPILSPSLSTNFMSCSRPLVDSEFRLTHIMVQEMGFGSIDCWYDEHKGFGFVEISKIYVRRRTCFIGKISFLRVPYQLLVRYSLLKKHQHLDKMKRGADQQWNLPQDDQGKLCHKYPGWRGIKHGKVNTGNKPATQVLGN